MTRFINILFIIVCSTDMTSGQTLTTKQIDSLCLSIDNNKALHEGITEGDIVYKKGKNGGWEIYDLKDDNEENLYRIKHNVSEKLYNRDTYYYQNKRLIKAIIEIEDWNSGKKMKKIYLATYYFQNNVLVKSENENVEYSTAPTVLRQGLKLQDDFYSTRK